MNDKEKQIEEINNLISEEYNNGNDNWFDIADKVYNKLFPEDSVVLSKEEYEKKKKHLQNVLELSNSQLEKVVEENEMLCACLQPL